MNAWLAVCLLPASGWLGAALPNAPSPEDYQHALNLGPHYASLVDGEPSDPAWVDAGHFIFRRGVLRENHAPVQEYWLVDVDTGVQRVLFERTRLAAALARASGLPVDADALGLRHLTFSPPIHLNFRRGRDHWRCNLAADQCEVVSRDPERYSWDMTPAQNAGQAHARTSPDGRWRAWVEHGQLVVARADGGGRPWRSREGSEADYHAASGIIWSPDSTRLALWQVQPAPPQIAHYLENAPSDQLLPKPHQQVYPRPGDPLPTVRPVLFNLTVGQRIEIDSALFPDPFSLSRLRWWDDSRGFTFEYNQRGHQRYRVIEVDAASGAARTLIEETSPTFIEYSDLSGIHANGGKRFRHDLDDGKQMIWASERDGWEHLYLYDGASGEVLRQITHGPWVVRKVLHVDAASRQVWFLASGMANDEDPYYRHAFRISLNGGDPVALTPEHADHDVVISPDGRWLLDLYSRVDLPPVLVLRRAADGGIVRTVAHTDISRLLAAGWVPPLPFHAPGRDGHTAIWGVIHRPQALDVARSYPVVEAIYAGPHGSFVPKTFTTRVEPLTVLGFAVAQIDGMGTNNRSRAFHDVAWRNLKDGGFPDRIAWHKAAAAVYPWYAIDAGVGIFGTSAGGQNALGALLFHPEFYTVAVANSGSHDNRVDKIWWNEQWMGYPVGPWYRESSNVDNAWRLQGRLLLITGDLDMNVDPASTLQVAGQLIKANKEFDLLLVPGGDHGAGGRYGQRRLLDFFVRWLGRAPTPEWNQITPEHALPEHRE